MMKGNGFKSKFGCPHCGKYSCYVVDGNTLICGVTRKYIMDFILDNEPGAYALPTAIVNKLIDEIIKHLQSRGYFPVQYDGTQGPARSGAIAFTRNEVPFRHEPIVIDYSYRQKSVTKIVIRDYEGKNREIHKEILEILSRNEIREYKNGSSRSPEKGTKVYAFMKQ